jgi:recombination protein RecA
MASEKRPTGAMNKIWDDISKTFGSDGLFEGDGDFIEPASPETSGSPALDEAIGIWGYPKGRLIQLAGHESSGKTLLSLMAIREWQRKAAHNWALFIDAEYTFDPDWASRLGVDLSRLRIMKTNSGAEIFERLCGKPHKEPGKPKVKKGILDLVVEQGGADKSGLGIIVLDSVAAVVPPQEAASEVGKQNVAALSRFLTPELRRILPDLANSQVVFLGINHLKTAIGQYGDPETSPGGKAWFYHCSLMLSVARIKKEECKIYNEAKEQVGHRIRAKIGKNKVAPPFREAEMDIAYLEGFINRHAEIKDLAVKYGIVKRPNNQTYVFEDLSVRGKDNFLKRLEQDPALCERLLSMVKDAKGSGAKPSEVSEEPEEDSGGSWEE